MKYSWFTMLYQFLLYSKVIQSKTCRHSFYSFPVWFITVNLCTKQTQTPRDTEHTCGCQGEGGGMDWECGVGRCKLLLIYWEWTYNKALLFSSGNYTSCVILSIGPCAEQQLMVFSINHHGKEHNKESFLSVLLFLAILLPIFKPLLHSLARFSFTFLPLTITLSFSPIPLSFSLLPSPTPLPNTLVQQSSEVPHHWCPREQKDTQTPLSSIQS